MHQLFMSAMSSHYINNIFFNTIDHNSIVTGHYYICKQTINTYTCRIFVSEIL